MSDATQERAEAMVVAWVSAEQFDTDRSLPAALALMITRTLLCSCCMGKMLSALNKHAVTGTALSKSLGVPGGVEADVWHGQVNQTYEALMATSFAAPKALS